MAKSPELDRKARVLKEQGVLNPEPEEILDERFRTEAFFDARDLVQVKYEMVRRVRSRRGDGYGGGQRPSAFPDRRSTRPRGLWRRRGWRGCCRSVRVRRVLTS